MTDGFEGYFLCSLQCEDVFGAVVYFSVFFPDDGGFAHGVSGKDEVSTRMETDGQLKGRRAVVTGSLVQLPVGPQHDVSEAFHSRSVSRQLLKQAFDDGIIRVQLKTLLVLFIFDCSLTSFLPFRSNRHRSCACVVCAFGIRLYRCVAPPSRKKKPSC